MASLTVCGVVWPTVWGVLWLILWGYRSVLLVCCGLQCGGVLCSLQNVVLCTVWCMTSVLYGV